MLNPDMLRSFLAVAEAGSFTGAARQIGISQSTISGHVARLETTLGRMLVARDTHRVALTPDGDALMEFARQVVDSSERLQRFFEGADLRGTMRLGAGEDFTLSILPSVLASFTERHSSVDLQVTVELSETLYRKYDAGELDVIFVKRRPGDERGQLAWRERLEWAGRPGLVTDPSTPLPLVLYPPPSFTRTMALTALEAAGRTWRVACTSGSLAGLRAAVHAGLGVAPHSPKLLPSGMAILPQAPDLPILGEVDFVVIGPGGGNAIAAALLRTVLECTVEVA